MAKKAVSAYSGGLDSTLLLILLKEKYGYDEVIPVMIDVGQGDEEITIAKERADILNIDPVFIDAKKEFTEDYIFRCVKANGSYQGYPVGTSMSRVLIAAKCAEVAQEVGAVAVSHGCTGKGNDQYRMEATLAYLAPELKVIAPIRELNLSRPDEEAMLKTNGIEPKVRRGQLGGDVNMWSHSIGSGQVEDLHSHYPSDYLWAVAPEETPDAAREVTITYREGVPVDVDGVTNPVDIILYLNKVGGEHGVGRIDILEDGIIGLKSRELYEAPAAEILLWADIVYHALWFHPLRRDLDAFIDSTQQYVNGQLVVKLYKGGLTITKRESRSGLFAPELRSIKKDGVFDQRQSTGAVQVFAIPFQLYGQKKR
jgi:argininosuccinate synthase